LEIPLLFIFAAVILGALAWFAHMQVGVEQDRLSLTRRVERLEQRLLALESEKGA